MAIKTLHLTNAYHATSGGIRTFYRAMLVVGLSCERMDDNVSAYLSPGRLGRALSRAYIRHLYGPPFDAHVANSEYTAGELRRNLWDRAPDFIHVCPMGVDFRRGRRDRSSARLEPRACPHSLATGGPAATRVCAVDNSKPQDCYGLRALYLWQQ